MTRIRRKLSLLSALLICLTLASTPVIFPEFSSVLPTLFERPPPSVIDPATVQPQDRIGQVLSIGGEAISLISAQQYRNATGLLKLASILPSNLQEDLRIYLSIVAEANNHLNLTRAYLNKTRMSLELGKLNDAKSQLGLARSELAEANSDVASLRLVLSRIESMFEVDVDSQRKSLTGLSSAIRDLENQADDIQSKLNQLDKREATVLELESVEKRILVNQTVTLVGSLKDSKGNALPQRKIDIYLQNTTLESTTTSGDGTFQVKARVMPGFNATEADFYAVYEPAHEDELHFRPSSSTDVIVEVYYLDAHLSVYSESSVVHVTQVFRISGKLSQTNNLPLTRRVVKLSVDGLDIKSTSTDTAGSFNFDYSFPAGAPDGTHNVTITFVPSNDPYSPQFASIPIRVIYYGTAISAVVPSGWLFSGETVQVAGLVTASLGGLEGGTVVALVDGKQAASTNVTSNGKFQLSFIIPLDASNNMEVTVAYVPSVAWLNGSSSSYRLPVANSLSAAAAFSALTLLGLAVYKTPGAILSSLKGPLKMTSKVEYEVLEPHREEGAVETNLILDVTRIRSKGSPKAIVRSAYWSVRELLVLALKAPSDRSHTHWEFFEATKSTLRDAQQNMRKLTLTFEKVEYAEQEISADDAEAVISDSIVVVETLGGRIKI